MSGRLMEKVFAVVVQLEHWKVFCEDFVKERGWRAYSVLPRLKDLGRAGEH
jgi:hypothetical protein